MSKRIVTLEHFRPDGPGKILGWIDERGHSLRRVFLDRGHDLPKLDEFDFLIVMGGPMNIYQHRDHPWLVPEKKFIRAAADAGKSILGICLGAQLLADVMGGKVMQNAEREVGWWPVRFVARPGPLASFPPELICCHWHGDTFELPPNAVHVAENDACKNQAFVIDGRLVGLQFHIEMGKIDIADLANALPEDLAPARYVQTAADLTQTPPREAELNAALFSLLDALAWR